MEYKESKEAKKRSANCFRSALLRFDIKDAKKLNKKMSWHNILIDFIDTNYPEFKENHYVQEEEYSVEYQFAEYIAKKLNVVSCWMQLKEQLTQYINNKLKEIGEC